MVTVTDSAKRELKRVLETRSLTPGKALRLAVPPVWTGEGDFGIVIDEAETEGVMVDFEGVTRPADRYRADGAVAKLRARFQGLARRPQVYPGRLLRVRSALPSPALLYG